jgi:AraC-like DNA-binding protein
MNQLEKVPHTLEADTAGIAALQTAVSHTIVRYAGYSLEAKLRPIAEAVVASLREGAYFGDRDVSVTLPASGGRTVVVSVRSGDPRLSSGKGTPAPGLDARQLRLINGTIHEKIAEPISVTMLSSVAGLSRSHFSHAFRTSVGRSPHAHVMRLRIERAMKLMTDSDAPLSEIALATGFSDQAHFSNTFRRTTGTTPKQWRRAKTPGAISPPRAV